jgi:xylulokinase
MLQAVSDATGLDQALPRVTIGAARGDAFLAGRAAGILSAADLDGWVEIGSTIAADPLGYAAAERRATRFRALYDETRATVHDLAGDP